MLNKSLFSSVKQDWETPQDFFDKLNDEFKFTLDACANDENAKCDMYYTEKDNALSKKWSGNVWVNSPYGRGIKNWVKYGYEQSCKIYNNFVVMLIPSRTCTRFWHDYVMKAAEIRLIKGRLTFIHRNSDVNNSAPFPSAIVIFKGAGRVPVFKSYERF